MGDEDDEEVKVKGMAEAAKQAEKGLALFKDQSGDAELDVEGATAFKAAEDAKMAELDEAIKGLTGKDNKKAKTEKEKEKKAIKDAKQYIDAEKVVKGKQPSNGFFMKKKEEEKPVEKKEEVKEEKKEDKKDEKKDKPKKAQESAGISKAERDELEKLKNDIIARKKELKETGLSGGAINKDEQVAGWVVRMNELKEKECPGAAQAKKDEKKSGSKSKLSADAQAEVEATEKEIEEYRQKLITEFKYTKKEINADPDMQDLNTKLNKLKGIKK